MKKNAFTLIEFLTALGIVGVIAVISGTTMSNLAPDKYKAKFMSAYTTISQVNQELLSEPAFYMDKPKSKDGSFPGNIYDADDSYGCSGLACTNNPTDSVLINIYPQNTVNLYFKGKNKYPNLLAYKLNNSTQDSQNNYSTNGQSYIVLNNGVIIQITGSNWSTDATSGNIKSCVYHLVMDIRNPKYPNSYCEFGEANGGTECLVQKNVFNRFQFDIRSDGKLIPMDNLSKAYLETPTQMSNRSADYARARELAQ